MKSIASFVTASLLIPILCFASPCPCTKPKPTFHKPYVAPIHTVHDTTYVYQTSRHKCIHWLVPFIAGAAISGAIVAATKKTKIETRTIVVDDD